MNTDIRATVDAAVQGQSRWILRKDTLTAALVLLVWLSQDVASNAHLLPERWSWVGTVAAAVVGIAGVAVHRFTPGAITPSMGPRLEAAADTGPTFSTLLDEES